MSLLVLLSMGLMSACGPPAPPTTPTAAAPKLPPSVIAVGGGQNVGASLKRLSKYLLGTAPIDPLQLARSLVSSLHESAVIKGNWRFALFEVAGDTAFLVLVPRSKTVPPPKSWQWIDVINTRIAIGPYGDQHLLVTTSPTWVDREAPFVASLLDRQVRDDIEVEWPLTRWTQGPLPPQIRSLEVHGAGPKWLQSHLETSLRQLDQLTVSWKIKSRATRLNLRVRAREGSATAQLLSAGPGIPAAALEGVPSGSPLVVVGRIEAAGWARIDRALRAAGDRPMPAEADLRAQLMAAVAGAFSLSVQDIGGQDVAGLLAILQPNAPSALAALIKGARPTADGQVRDLVVDGLPMYGADTAFGLAIAVGQTGRAVLEGLLKGTIDQGPTAHPALVEALADAPRGTFLLASFDALDVFRMVGNERLAERLEGLPATTPQSIAFASAEGHLSVEWRLPKDQMRTLVAALMRLFPTPYRRQRHRRPTGDAALLIRP